MKLPSELPFPGTGTAAAPWTVPLVFASLRGLGRVVVALSARLDPATSSVAIGTAELARLTGLSPRSVQRALAHLEKSAYIERRRAPRGPARITLRAVAASPEPAPASPAESVPAEACGADVPVIAAEASGDAGPLSTGATPHPQPHPPAELAPIHRDTQPTTYDREELLGLAGGDVGLLREARLRIDRLCARFPDYLDAVCLPVAVGRQVRLIRQRRWAGWNVPSGALTRERACTAVALESMQTGTFAATLAVRPVCSTPGAG